VITIINWGAVIVGFCLSIILGAIFGTFGGPFGGILGVFIAGMVVGYMVNEDAMNGATNGAISGAFGAIIIAILMIIFGTLLLGIVGFAVAGFTAILLLISTLGVVIIMAVGGAVGAMVKGES